MHANNNLPVYCADAVGECDGIIMIENSDR